MMRYRTRRLAEYFNELPLDVAPTDYEDGDIFIYANSAFERATRTIPCAKEPDTIRWIQELIKPGDVVFDIGANIGNYSLIIAKHHNQTVQVFAFEPAWFNFMQLNRNVSLNGLGISVFPLCVAFSDKTGISWLNYSTLEYGSSMHALGRAIRLRDQEFAPALKQPVPTYTVDQAVEYLGRIPNHIKLDVDGIESEILAGASSTLENLSVRSVLVELCGDNPDDQRAIENMLARGFKIWNVQEKPRNEFVNFAAHANYIFVR